MLLDLRKLIGQEPDLGLRRSRRCPTKEDHRGPLRSLLCKEGSEVGVCRDQDSVLLAGAGEHDLVGLGMNPIGSNVDRIMAEGGEMGSDHGESALSTRNLTRP